MAVLECANLSRWFGDVIAVNDITLEIEPGIVGFLGPNGAGKSTFMKLAMGLLRPSSGSIRVLGENPWRNKSLLRRVGHVAEGDAPWRDRSGRACAELGARLSGLKPNHAREAAGRALEQVGLNGPADLPIATYSRGMRQRLKFALALMHDPELLILDEPLLGSDPVARREIIRLIEELAKQGKSVMVSTHVLADVEAMTKRILLIDHGRVMAHGEVAEIRELLDRYPRTVRIGTPEPMKLGSLVWMWDAVVSVAHETDAVVVTTHRPKEFFSSLQTLLVHNQIPVTSVTSLDDSLDAVFRYLVRAE